MSTPNKRSLIDDLEKDARHVTHPVQADAADDIAEWRDALKHELPERMVIAEGNIVWSLILLGIAAFLIYQVGNGWSKALFGTTLLGEVWPYAYPLETRQILTLPLWVGLAGWIIYLAVAPLLRRHEPLLTMTAAGIQLRGQPAPIAWEAVHGVDYRSRNWWRSRFTVILEPDYPLVAPAQKAPGITYQPDAHRITLRTFEPMLDDAAQAMNSYAYQAHAHARLAALGASTS